MRSVSVIEWYWARQSGHPSTSARKRCASAAFTSLNSRSTKESFITRQSCMALSSVTQMLSPAGKRRAFGRFHIDAEMSAQFADGPEQRFLDGSRGAPEDFGNRLTGHSFSVLQQKD